MINDYNILFLFMLVFIWCDTDTGDNNYEISMGSTFFISEKNYLKQK